MPSYQKYAAMKLKDLRSELASRNLPTQGLKQDLVFRLGSLDDDAHDSSTLQSSSLPHDDGADPAAPSSPIIINNGEGGTSAKKMVVGDSRVPTTMKVSEKSLAQLLAARTETPLLLPTVPDDYHDGDDRSRPISNNRIRLSISISLISLIIIFLFLSSFLWHTIPTALKDQGQDHLSTMSISTMSMNIITNIHHFPRSTLINYANLIISHAQQSFHFFKNQEIQMQMRPASASAAIRPFPFSAIIDHFLAQGLGLGKLWAAKFEALIESCLHDLRTVLMIFLSRWRE